MSTLLSPPPRFVTPPRRIPQNPSYDVRPQITSNLQNQNPPAGLLFQGFHSPPESATPHSINFPGSPHSSRDGKASKFETKQVSPVKGSEGRSWCRRETHKIECADVDNGAEFLQVNFKPMIKGVDFGPGPRGYHVARGSAPALLPRPAVDLRRIRCGCVAIYGARPSRPCCTYGVRCM
jgi:hypothetical protein